MSPTLIGLALLGLLLSACATLPTAGSDQPLVAGGLVVDDGDGPQLCLAGVNLSFVPSCEGLPLRGWRWPADGVTRVGGTTYGGFGVVGTWDGRRFTVQRVIDREGAPSPAPDRGPVSWTTPCAAPPGGWRAPDPERATSETQSAAIRAAHSLPDFGRLWIDDLGDPAQDPARVVLNVAVTEDPGRAERTLREVYGGALCVSRGSRTHAELRAIQQELLKRPDVIECGLGDGRRVELGVVYDDGTLQRALDDGYGAGTVRVRSHFQPYRE